MPDAMLMSVGFSATRGDVNAGVLCLSHGTMMTSRSLLLPETMDRSNILLQLESLMMSLAKVFIPKNMQIFMGSLAPKCQIGLAVLY